MTDDEDRGGCGFIAFYLLCTVLIVLAVVVFAYRHAHGAEAGLWPPDDRPRADVERLIEIVRSCRTVAGYYDREGRMRGFQIECDF
jgi:hypothetical protein